MSITEAQKAIVTATVPLLAKHGVEIVCKFYETLLHEHPELNEVFSHTNQITMRQQTALAGALHAYASNINDLTPILPVVEKICQKHASLNVLAEHYAVVGDGILRALRQVLGEEVFSGQVRDAWAAAYEQIAGIMSSREEAVYKSHEQTAAGWRGWRKMRVVRKVKESDEVTSFYLRPVTGKLPIFQAGQYVSVKLFVPSLGYDQTRQYSLSDAPRHNSGQPTNGTKGNCCNETTEGELNEYRISVKLEKDSAMNRDGDVSSMLHTQVQENDIIEMSNPAGEFVLETKIEQQRAPIVLMSAGVGLTPLLSMLQTSVQHRNPRGISWIHVAKNANTDAFVHDVRQLAQKHDNLRALTFHTCPTAEEVEGRDFDHKGRPDVRKLEQMQNGILYLDNSSTVYYLCGPNSFMDDAQGGLKSLGIADECIKMEMFSVGV